MLPGKVKIARLEIRPTGEVLIFSKTAEFLFTYVKFEMKGHPVETGNWNFTEPKRTFKKADMVFTI